MLALGCTLFAVGEWVLPAFRRDLFVLGAVALLAPLALPFHSLGYQRAFSEQISIERSQHRHLVRFAAPMSRQTGRKGVKLASQLRANRRGFGSPERTPAERRPRSGTDTIHVSDTDAAS